MVPASASQKWMLASAAVELGAREPRHQIVEGAERDQRVPAERARVHVADRPLGEVADDVDAADRHHRPLERRETVEREREHDELQRRIRAQLSHALLTVMMPLIIVAHDGASRMRLMTMPSDCTHSGIAL